MVVRILFEVRIYRACMLFAGGPMLGISFAALVAGCRLDPWCFVLTASADFLAAVGATVWVGPVAHALPTVRALTVKKGT